MAVNQTHTASAGQQEASQAQAPQQGVMQSGNPGQDESQRRRDTVVVRRDSFPFVSPFALLQRFFSDDLVNLFDELGGRRGEASPQLRAQTGTIAWVPKIDVMQRANELVVRLDLPGVTPDDVTVEISDAAVTISGERKQEHAEENGSIYRFERSYGAFFREIPLPEGAIVNQARASFKDGVLEISVPAPPEQVSRGRRLEISRADSAKQSESTKKGGA